MPEHNKVEAIRRRVQKNPGAVSIEVKPAEKPVVFETSPDPDDGHTHEIPIWALDSNMTGSTVPATSDGQDEPHVHAIVKGKIRPYVLDDFVSKHDVILDEDGEEITPSSDTTSAKSSPSQDGPDDEKEESRE